MRVTDGQASLLQVVAGVAIVAILLLILFVTQTSSSAQTFSQQAQQSQADMTRHQLDTLLSTSYYRDGRDNLDVSELISRWCEYDSTAALTGQDMEKDEYITTILDQRIAGGYRIRIECKPGDTSINQVYIRGSTPPDGMDVFADTRLIPDSTDSTSIRVRLETWN